MQYSQYLSGDTMLTLLDKLLATHAGQKNLGKKFKTGISSHESISLRDLMNVIADLSAWDVMCLEEEELRFLLLILRKKLVVSQYNFTKKPKRLQKTTRTKKRLNITKKN